MTTREGRRRDPIAETLIPFDISQITHPANRSNPQDQDPAPTLGRRSNTAIAFGIRRDAQRDGIALTPSPDSNGVMRLRDPGLGITEELAPTLDTVPHIVAFHTQQDPISGDVSTCLGGRGGGGVGVHIQSGVRRLTPTECERLMGFPDGYTKIPGAKDDPRYAALGNSIGTKKLVWLGERIAAVDRLTRESS